MELEAPPMPPQMPNSLRQHLYSRGQQQQLQRRRQQILQQQRHFMALKAARLQRDPKHNPYSISYSDGLEAAPRTGSLLNSPANAIRRPGGVTNSVNIKGKDTILY
ncbi:hypothetical protein ElyMa_003266300 [Elysia marginata]|uniref:Histone deacetylase n=1 Tax=Elysia marginata TaxID=1093978 RepID=A0AAV4JA62_9GAST|nr:hypothetical protein ElyMa_003266300 [Elysia marginata]